LKGKDHEGGEKEVEESRGVGKNRPTGSLSGSGPRGKERGNRREKALLLQKKGGNSL